MKKKLWIIAAIALGIALLVLLVLLGIYIFSPRSEVKYVAHMGYSAQYVGNTAEAFQAAAGLGFYGIETDVRETKDGVFVCHHDAEAILADGTKKEVSDSTFAELTATQLKTKKTNQPFDLCTFETYLDICKSGGKVAVIELKEVCNAEKLGRILDLVDLHYDRKKVTFIAFDFVNLTRLRAIDPTLSLQYLSESKDDPCFADCLEQKISIDVKQNVLTKTMVKDFHAAGLTVNVWTVNRKYDLSIVRIKGVDYVTTDNFYEEEKK